MSEGLRELAARVAMAHLRARGTYRRPSSNARKLEAERLNKEFNLRTGWEKVGLLHPMVAEEVRRLTERK